MPAALPLQQPDEGPAACRTAVSRQDCPLSGVGNACGWWPLRLPPTPPAALALSAVLPCHPAAGPDERALPRLAAVPLSEDHKPNRIDERQRIESAGGVVVWAGTWRVGGVLAVSRAFGDRLLKRYVVAMPDITEQVRTASQLVQGSRAMLRSKLELCVQRGGLSQ